MKSATFKLNFPSNLLYYILVQLKNNEKAILVMTSPIFSLREIDLTFGAKPLFTKLSLNIYPNDRICLVGKNGEGKSSLLKTIAGIYELDGGEMWIQPGVSIGYLPQEINFKTDQTIYDFVLQEIIDKDHLEDSKYLADIIITPLKLNPHSKLSELSGGLLRRAFLAKALVTSPEILLLDEPTNHLDIDSIEWLEEYVKRYSGAIVCISHDRTFLKNISNKTFWLDRGKVKTNNLGYENFDKWSVEILEQEQRELDKLGKKLSEEEAWKAQGIKARRKRNQKRLHDLYALRQKAQAGQAARRVYLNKIKFDPLTPVQSSKLVFEFKDVYKSYGSKKILESFSMRTMRGEKIGIVGPNGTGKTTFLRMLVGSEHPDQGAVKIGKTINVTYYDQKRMQLDPQETLWECLCSGTGDHIKVGDNFIHVVAYLKNFMFDPKMARDKVATLSGGQANRLLLAKALANPGSLLILDEPTNDLDMDTLDMIADILGEYSGTLIIVSHDRAFLDSLVTKTLYFDGNGVIEEFIGSYEDLRQLKKKQEQAKSVAKTKTEETKVKMLEPKKLSYHLQRELTLMPAKIASLEEEIDELESELLKPNFYQDAPKEFNEKSQRLVAAKKELEESWLRWQELENL